MLAKATRRTLVMPSYCAEPVNAFVSDSRLLQSHYLVCHPACRHFQLTGLGVPVVPLDLFVTRLVRDWVESSKEGAVLLNADAALLDAAFPGHAIPLTPLRSDSNTDDSLLTALRQPTVRSRSLVFFAEANTDADAATPSPKTTPTIRLPLSRLVRDHARCFLSRTLTNAPNEPFVFVSWRTAGMSLHPEWCAAALENRLEKLREDDPEHTQTRVVLSTDLVAELHDRGSGTFTARTTQARHLTTVAITNLAKRLNAVTSRDGVPRNVSLLLLDAAISRHARTIALVSFRAPPANGKLACAPLSATAKLLYPDSRVWAPLGEPLSPPLVFLTRTDWLTRARKVSNLDPREFLTSGRCQAHLAKFKRPGSTTPNSYLGGEWFLVRNPLRRVSLLVNEVHVARAALASVRAKNVDCLEAALLQHPGSGAEPEWWRTCCGLDRKPAEGYCAVSRRSRTELEPGEDEFQDEDGTAIQEAHVYRVRDPYEQERLVDDKVIAFVEDPAQRALCGDARGQVRSLAPWLRRIDWMARVETPEALLEKIRVEHGWTIRLPSPDSATKRCSPHLTPQSSLFQLCNEVWVPDTQCFGYRGVPHCVSSFVEELVS